NGGIQNKAFWLLAQNSTNTNASPYNQIAVTGIGRTKAEKIFYRALTGGYLTYSDRLFYNVRTATLAAACANPPLGYGPSSQECASTGQAWAAVGVPANDIDAPRDFVLAHYRDFLFRNPDVSGWDFWTNQITSCA